MVKDRVCSIRLYVWVGIHVRSWVRVRVRIRVRVGVRVGVMLGLGLAWLQVSDGLEGRDEERERGHGVGSHSDEDEGLSGVRARK